MAALTKKFPVRGSKTWRCHHGPDNRSWRDSQAGGTMSQLGTALGPFSSPLGMMGGKEKGTCQVRVSLCEPFWKEMPSCTKDGQKGSSPPGEPVPAEMSITVWAGGRRKGLLPGCSCSGIRHACRRGTPWWRRRSCPPPAPWRWCMWYPSPKAPS